jgi:hypothetical protein
MFRAPTIGSKILYDKMKKREHDKHKNRLINMKSSLSTFVPKTSSKMSINLKRQYMIRQRNKTVDKDNQLLLDRMKEIANRYNKFSGAVHSSSFSSATSPNSPNEGFNPIHGPISHAERHDQASTKHLMDAERKRNIKMKKIEFENIRFARRLEMTRGEYSVARAREEWSQNRDYLERICSHPVVMEMFGPNNIKSGRVTSPRISQSGSSPRRISPPQKNGNPSKKNSPRRPSTTEPSRRRRGGSTGRAGRNVIQHQQQRPRAKRTRPTNNSGRRTRPVTTASISNTSANSMLITSPTMAAAMENNQSNSSTSSSPTVTWTDHDVKIGSEIFTVCGFSLGQEHGGILFEARSKSLSGVIYRLTASSKHVQKSFKSLKKMKSMGI